MLVLGVWFVVSAGLHAGALDLIMRHSHPLVERVLGETPQADVAAYLEPIRQGDRQAALTRWSAPECVNGNLETRRQGVTDEPLTMGLVPQYRILETQWWRTCSWPELSDDTATAGAARIRVGITDDGG
jgi:hypothetical protein